MSGAATLSTDPDAFPGPVPPLCWSGTVDRALLHRRNPSEAFLTDAVRTGPDSFAAAALLPPAHPHYGGHTGPSRHRDPMLLLECARQAETYAAHALYGVEPDAHFVLRAWSAEFAAPGTPPAEFAAPGTAEPSSAGTELLITAVTSNARLVRDRLRGLDYDLRLWVGAEQVGRVRMEVGYLGHPAYTVVRAREHPGGLPSSDRFTPAAGCPVEPALVGRLRATDAVLLDVAAGERTVGARLRVPVDNPSLFDHAQDHIPAMVLVEAARQLAALATRHWGGAAPDRTRMAAVSSSFNAYAELAEPLELTAVPAGPAVEVGFTQAGTAIAQARVEMTGAGPERSATWHGPPS
ncbi:MAG: 2-oxo-3-(phosphooxy)propyl 3-oxoalkanoate synthase [Blastocatellia bacterium]|nr:2-oxo-3-(phosphooxy)propyl 3-oxoalkanoate synthase [Blastocatellia bacterium]